MAISSGEEFRGTERFAIRRRLGAGAYGVVYEAFDRERESLVALKTLRSGSVEALYRLKREFRSLADIAHPNLATLHEMLADGDDWFITMELVNGVNFLQHVRPHPESSEAAALDPTISEIPPGDESCAPSRPTAAAAPFDDSRLRHALRQAVSAVSALHDAGKLHRDIKPSNVLVTPEGRVVMLDFGFVTEFDGLGEDHSLSLVGTPAYMAPELGSRTGVSEASDWYSLGVMLYEALTGRQPFAGSFSDMMWEKNRSDPPPPRSLVPRVPDDLDALCRDLLRRSAADRPSGRDILKRLGAPPSAHAPEPASLSLRPGPFVGRNAELAVLREAFETSRRGQAARVYVHGTSGIGKSALVRRFIEDLRREDVVVLSGRCYEHESTPYKALDSVIDLLSQYLKRLPTAEAEALLPADILALTRVFPVLRRVEAVSATRRKLVEIADSLELRRRAFAALRELFVRLAGSRDVVLFIDDLQWGDADSAALLEELVRPPDPPALLLITSYRSEEAETSPLLRRLLSASDSADVRNIAVEELTPSEARDLATTLLESNPSTPASMAEAIARESAGNPFFIDELIRFGRPGVVTTLDSMVRARVRHLPDSARTLLEVVAVAGQPLDVEVAEGAAATKGELSAVAALRAGRLVRVRNAGDRQEIEPYHDRIREAVVTQVPAETRRTHHHRLAVALEASGRADPEPLAHHFREAGDVDRAAHYAASGADRAAEALAFDRAAKLYRLALELETSSDAEKRRKLGIRLGDSLANAGRGAESARAYLVAAEGASTAQALELEGRAAGLLLQAGYVDQALPIFERITGRVGLTLIQSSAKSRLLFLLERIAIRLRGLRFRERDASRLPPEKLIRLDGLWLLASGMVLVNTLRARELNNRHLLMALGVGEPSHVAIALATELGVDGTIGWRLAGRIKNVQALAMSLAERLKNPRALGMVHAYASAANLLLGLFKDCSEHGRTAEKIYRERCTGVAWELDFAHMMLLRGLAYLGELRELSLRVPELIREAQQRNDLMAVETLQIRHSYLNLLAVNQPKRAKEEMNQIASRLSRKPYGNQQYWAMFACGEIALYESDARRAWKLLEDQWPGFRRSGLVRFQFWRVEALHLRARSAVALSARADLEASDRAVFLRSAEKDTRRIGREGAPWASALALLLHAGLATNRRNPAEAAGLLSSAERDLETLDMALYAAAARRRRGELLGGDAGRALIAQADEWMAGQLIRDPARMADMLAPGRWS